MSENDEKQPADPFAQMIQFYDDWTKTWSGAASDMVSSKPFADSMAQQLESSLSAMGLMRRQLGELMEQSLQQMSLPTRKDLLSIAERMTNMEMRLDDVIGRVYASIKNYREVFEERLGGLAARLEALSPLKVLARGFSVTLKLPEGKIAKSIKEVAKGGKLKTLLSDGTIISTAEEIRGQE